MKLKIFVLLSIFLNCFILISQEDKSPEERIEELKVQKIKVETAERNALKEKVKTINKRLKSKEISSSIADSLKTEAATLHAANIEDRIAIVNKNISLLQRNNGLIVQEVDSNSKRFEWGLGHKNNKGERIFGVRYKRKKPKPFKYDKRLYSDFVIVVGNNHLVGKNSTYDISAPNNNAYYYELGWAWRYRLNKERNNLRLHYGISFQGNRFSRPQPLFEPEVGSFGIFNDGVLEPSPKEDYVISKTRLNTRSLILPFHLEMGPSKLRKTDSSIRYSVKNKFRFGVGGYLGVNLGLEQQTEATFIGSLEVAKESFKGFHTMGGLEEDRFVYGVSLYVGAGSFLFYTKLNLSTLYIYQNNKYKIATVGLKVDM